ncbi:hypothetical protein [Aquimarina agarilytica]|uniref:hypothetical protein n=1 Tax=Aquimarina agarilytica TaxID=1087449 RepID=UPI000289EDA7|nr:hypothetical protein [Aquimarina agarilytica]
MKNSNYLSAFIVAFSFLFSSFEKSRNSTNSIKKGHHNNNKQSIDISTKKQSIEFDNVIYKGKTYSKNKIKKNKTLSNLIKNPTFFFINEIRNYYTKKIDFYVFDTAEEHSQFTTNFETETINELDSIDKSQDISVSFFNVKSYKRLLYKTIYKDLQTDTAININLPHKLQDSTSSLEFKSTGNTNGYSGRLFLYNKTNQRGLLGKFSAQNQLKKYDFINYNNRIDSYKIIVSK